MMKKLLVLTLVLGMAMPLYAGIILSVKEMDGSTYNGRILNASDYLKISIVAGGTDTVAASFALVADPLKGTTAGGTGVYGVSGMLGTVEEWGVGNVPVGMTGQAGQVGHTTVTAPYPQGTVMINEILFHCEGPGDVVLTMYDISFDWDCAYTPGVDIAPDGIWDTVVIHQTPEPMTMLLLGLGGLFLRKR